MTRIYNDHLTLEVADNRHAGALPGDPCRTIVSSTVVPHEWSPHMYKSRKGMNENTIDQMASLSLTFLLTTRYQHCSMGVQREIDEERFSKMLGGLTDLVLALLHAVAAPCRRHRDHHGGQCHHRSVLTPASPQQPPPSATPHCCVLERPPSPFPDRPAYRPMEPSNPDTSPWGRRGRPFAVQGWGCPNLVAPAQGTSSSSYQGEEEGRKQEDNEHCITVVTGPIGAPVIHRMTRLSVGPQGRPQGSLAPWIDITLLTLLTLSAPPPPALPSPESNLSGFGTPRGTVESVR
jgi:hypothetical protein